LVPSCITITFRLILVTLLLDIGHLLWLGVDVGDGRWPGGRKIIWRSYVLYIQHFGLVDETWLNWDQAGPLGKS
jgi:hypothetical protein